MQRIEMDEKPSATLVCHCCSWRADLSNHYVCPECGESLEIQYACAGQGIRWKDSEPGIWRHRDLLPISLSTAPVTLGEGNTPLLPARNLACSQQPLLKNETVNPTGSFKDRPVAVAMTVAREFGLRGVLCASTGNTAVAVAAYAARARLPTICLVPEVTPVGKLVQILAAGARIVHVRGTYSDAYGLAQHASVRHGWANLTSTYVNPYMLEGDKTVGYEIFEQLGGRTPDWIMVPVGAGPLLAGIDKAFRELRELGATREDGPRMAAVQATGCAPIVQAFAKGAATVTEWRGAIKTAASSIADPLLGYSADGTRTLSVVRNSHGVAMAVSEGEIQDSMIALARHEGLLVEPGAAAVIAGYYKLIQRGLLQAGQTAVLILTGHGLKDVNALQDAIGRNAHEGPPLLQAGDTETLGQLLESMSRGSY